MEPHPRPASPATERFDQSGNMGVVRSRLTRWWRGLSTRGKAAAVGVGVVLVLALGLTPPASPNPTVSPAPTSGAVASVPPTAPPATPAASPSLSAVPSTLPSGEPTPASTPAPAAQPSPRPLPLRITRRTGRVPTGSVASVTIKTVRGARCSILVEYASGPSDAAGLNPKRANPRGVVTWRWEVGSNTTRGTWPISIHCQAGSRSGSADTQFRVT
jgi:hypothetical protein